MSDLKAKKKLLLESFKSGKLSKLELLAELEKCKASNIFIQMPGEDTPSDYREGIDKLIRIQIALRPGEEVTPEQLY